MEVPSKNLSRIARRGRQILENKKMTIGLAIFVPLLIAITMAPYIVPFDPTETHTSDRFADPGGEYLLGTDKFGRDILSRVLMGGRTSLILGFGSVGLALLLGVPIGLISGYYGGVIDEIVMRMTDVVISFPSLLLALLIVAGLGPGLTYPIFAIATAYFPRLVRVVRIDTLSAKNEDYVTAAQAMAETDRYILARAIFPHVSFTAIAEGTVRIGFAILVGSSLSFLGLGTQPPNPDWGFMISEARDTLWLSPWFLLWPSISLAITVMSLNLIGDGLRDLFDVQG
jgi:peptide/nickel transport system permease protein